MKGVIFNVFEDCVSQEFGPDAWEELLDEADVAGAYTSLGNYSDDEINALLGAVAAKQGKTNADALRWFGESAMPILKERYPGLFANYASSRNFVLAVNTIIHPEVRKLYSGVSCPYFHFKEAENGAIFMGYESSRKMCDLAHGFIVGASKLWCEEVNITHHTCMNHDDDKCLMEIQWQR